MNETFDFEGAAKYLKISCTALSDLVAIGEVPAAKISRCWVFREADLAYYLETQVRIQTEQRREAYQAGRMVHINSAVGEVRKGKRRIPAPLPPLPE